MSLQLLTPVFAIIPCAPPSPGQPMNISGLVQIQPGANPASVEPSDYQVAFYAFTSQGFVLEGTAPLTACGTWSMVGSNGYQYEAVVMQAGITPQGNYGLAPPSGADPSQNIYGVCRTMTPAAPYPNLSAILNNQVNVFPQFLGSAAAAFQACAGVLGNPGCSEQQLLGVINHTSINTLKNVRISIASQYGVALTDVDAVIDQLKQWVTNVSDVNAYFQQLWDFLVDKFLPQTAIISAVAADLYADLVQTQKTSFDWWSFFTNLLSMASNILAPGLGSVLEGAVDALTNATGALTAAGEMTQNFVAGRPVSRRKRDACWRLKITPTEATACWISALPTWKAG